MCKIVGQINVYVHSTVSQGDRGAKTGQVIKRCSGKPQDDYSTTSQPCCSFRLPWPLSVGRASRRTGPSVTQPMVSVTGHQQKASGRNIRLIFGSRGRRFVLPDPPVHGRIMEIPHFPKEPPMAITTAINPDTWTALQKLETPTTRSFSAIGSCRPLPRGGL